MFILISITVYSKKKNEENNWGFNFAYTPQKKKILEFCYDNRDNYQSKYDRFKSYCIYQKKSTLWCKPQSTHFEIQQTILEYLLKKAKIQIFDRNPDPMVIIETRTKGISITPWPSDYNWITNQRYKVWTPQGRISDNFIVLEEPKEEQNLTFSNFFIQ